MGRTFGAATSSMCAFPVIEDYTASTVTQAYFIATAPVVLTNLGGRPRVVGSDGSAVTLTFYKCKSGVAAASGTLLHAGSYDCKGTADTNQVLTLVANQDSLTFNTGDSLNVVLTGTPTSMVGMIQATFEPLAP